MKHRYQSFTRIGRQFQSLERQVYADWTSVSFPLCQRSCLIWRTMANNDDEYNDEYNDEYLCRDFFVGFNFWSRLSFQISEFRVHCSNPLDVSKNSWFVKRRLASLQPEVLLLEHLTIYKHRTKRKFPPKYIRINSKQMNRC